MPMFDNVTVSFQTPPLPENKVINYCEINNSSIYPYTVFTKHCIYLMVVLRGKQIKHATSGGR